MATLLAPTLSGLQSGRFTSVKLSTMADGTASNQVWWLGIQPLFLAQPAIAKSMQNSALQKTLLPFLTCDN
ncbi:hypothetical protein, partial [Nitrosomonas sp.]|uniref:hypothetical protein n=1 Tax=Nitrosomonas sp. TaxID=42353 RepID=UPI0025CFF286